MTSSPAVQLRHYQLVALDEIRAAIRMKKRRIMLQLPTGGGKTLAGVAMLVGALAKGNRSLFVAHRLELIDQTVKTFARLDVLSIGVIRAKDKRRDASQPIQVASIQTLVKRQWPTAQIVFVDEAHRACAKSYEKLWAAYPDAIIVGLSATPCRADGRPLGARFEHMVHGATYSQLIAEGFIVEPAVYGTPMLPDLSQVSTSGGDYDQEELARAVNKSALIGNLLHEYQLRAEGRRTVIFAVSIAHSQDIVAEFTAAGIAAEHLDGATAEEERRAILARLASGETQVVSNVGVLCEGWDLPACKCLLLARPTKSLALYMQMSGRILRPWCPLCDGKCEHESEPGHGTITPVVVDCGGNVDRHGLPHEDRTWSLSEKPKKGAGAPVKACKQCFAMIRASAKVCPHCGFVFPKSVAEPVEKEQLTHVELALRTIEGDKAAYFRKLASTAQQRGWKPGSVVHRYKERYNGELPPMDWWRALKKTHESDPTWQAAVTRRPAPPTFAPGTEKPPVWTEELEREAMANQ